MVDELTTVENALVVKEKVSKYGFVFTETGMEVANSEASEEQVCEIISDFNRVNRMSQICLGDLIAFGQAKYKWELKWSYEEMERRTGIDRQRLYNYANVARHVPQENRHPDLTYSDYDAVDSLEPKEQRVFLEKRLRGEYATSDQLKQAVYSHTDHTGPEYRSPCPSCGTTLITRKKIEWIGVE